MTSIAIFTVSLPPVFVAVMVYVPLEVIVVGTPLMTPVLGLSDRPSGRLGDTDQDKTAPPLYVGVPDENAESLVKENGLPAYSINDGATSFTVISTFVVALPPVLVAVIV